MADLTPLPDGPLSSDTHFAEWVVSKKKFIFVLGILAAIFWTILYFGFTVDDAYISFRYGKNLVAHHLWNWNSSGLHEEAYTSAIYTALSIIPALLHMSPALFFKFIGLGTIAVILYRLRTSASTPFGFFLAFLLVVLNPWLWTHAFAGLETPLYLLLILEMAIAVHRAPTVSAPWVYTLFLLLPLTRPEGIVFACAGVILFWKLRSKAPKQLPYFALALGLAIFYFLARWHYFQNLLPNPYYVKVGHNSLRSLLSHLALNLTQFKAYFLTLIVVLAFARKLPTRVFALCALLLLLFLFAPHRVAMNYSDRFYFQLVFPILLFFFITEDVARISRAAALIAVFSLIGISDGYLKSNLTYFADFSRSNIDLGHRLAPFAPGHSLVTGEAGGIPYFSNWFVYDPVGIGTGQFARHGLTLSSVQQLHPDLIFIYSSYPDARVLDTPLGDPTGFDAVLLDYIRQSGQYHYAGACRWPIGYYLVAFLRDDTPQHDQILTALQQNTRVSADQHHSIKDLLLQRYVPWTD